VGLDVAVDDAAAMGEARRAQDLDREVDRVLRRQRPVLLDELLERPPVETETTFWWFRPAALRASRRKRSTNSGSSAKRLCMTFSATWRPSWRSSAQ
jgi:hypothetical protein